MKKKSSFLHSKNYYWVCGAIVIISIFILTTLQGLSESLALLDLKAIIEKNVWNTIEMSSKLNTISPQVSSTKNQVQNTTSEIHHYAPDIEQILNRGTLIIAILEKDNPPFFQLDTPETPCKGNKSQYVVQDHQIFCGLDIELAKGIAKELGVNIKFDRHSGTFNDVVTTIFEHRADIAISKISRTLNRTQKVIFSTPYVNMKQALLVNRVQFTQQAEGRRPELVIRDLKGNVGVINNSSYVSFTQQKFPLAEVREYDTWEDSVEAARKGDIIAAYRDELEVKRTILQNPDIALSFQTVILTDTNDRIAMVLPWDSQQLREFVNEYLESNQINYTADSLLEEYSELLIHKN